MDTIELRLDLDPFAQSLFLLNGRPADQRDRLPNAVTQKQRRVLELGHQLYQTAKDEAGEDFDHDRCKFVNVQNVFNTKFHREDAHRCLDEQERLFSEENVQNSVVAVEKMRCYGAEIMPEIHVTASHGLSKVGTFVKFKDLQRSSQTVTIPLHHGNRPVPKSARLVFTLYFHTFTETGDPVRDFAGQASMYLSTPPGSQTNLRLRDDSLSPKIDKMPEILLPVGNGYVKGELTVDILARNYHFPRELIKERGEWWESLPQYKQSIYDTMKMAIQHEIMGFFVNSPRFFPLYEADRMIQTPVMRGTTTIMPGGAYALRKVPISGSAQFWRNLVRIALLEFRYTALAQGTDFASDEEEQRVACFVRVVSEFQDIKMTNKKEMSPLFFHACEVAASAIQLYTVSLPYEPDFVNQTTYRDQAFHDNEYKPNITGTDKYPDNRTTHGGDCDNSTGCIGNFYSELTEHRWPNEPPEVTACRTVLLNFVLVYAHPRVTTASIQEQEERNRQQNKTEPEEVQNHMVPLLIPRKLMYERILKALNNRVVCANINDPDGHLMHCKRMLASERDPTKSRLFGHHPVEDNLRVLIVEGTGKVVNMPGPSFWNAPDERTAQQVAFYDQEQRELQHFLAERGMHQGSVGPVKMPCEYPTDSRMKFYRRGAMSSTFYQEFVGCSTSAFHDMGIPILSFYFAREMDGNVQWGVPFVDMVFMDKIKDVIIGPTYIPTPKDLCIIEEEMKIEPPVPYLELPDPEDENREFSMVSRKMLELQRQNKIKLQESPNPDDVSVMFAINSQMWESRACLALDQYMCEEPLRASLFTKSVSQHPADPERHVYLIFLAVHRKVKPFDEVVNRE